VLGGEHIPALFSIYRCGMGLGCLLGPTIAGQFHSIKQLFNMETEDKNLNYMPK